ncbi:mechanosensitive ion channel family protein [Microvirga flavescens]|uniref:mechanosensitive ion channel family protein n=1 Tax=Microvirga flavescens TaxID=2249811 RepID=UPI000DD861CE|nr:mechanosensitive ion channel family protein [Microvirga flavescens]
MAEAAELAEDTAAIIKHLESLGSTLEQSLLDRIAHLGQVKTDYFGLKGAVEAQGLSLTKVLLLFIGVSILSYLLLRACRHLLRRWVDGEQPFRSGLATIASAIMALAIMFGAMRLLVSDETLRGLDRIWAAASVLSSLAYSGLRGLLEVDRNRRRHLNRRARHFCQVMGLAVAWALFGIALVTTARTWNAGPGLRDFLGTGLVLIPVTALLCYAYCRHHLTVTAIVAGPRPRSGWRKRFAIAWPLLATSIVVITVLAAQIGAMLGRPLPPFSTFVSLLLVLVAPNLDTVVSRWAERGVENKSVSILAAAMRRTLRFVILIAIATLLTYIWIGPILVAMGLDYSTVTAGAIGVALVALSSAFLWNAVGSLTSRLAQSEGHDGTAHENGAPRTRLGTLLPLISGTAKISIFALGLLTMLIVLGINVWPIITGLSVFGLAIGFGSQTLVKDIVSGLFFLIDDAFRLGEYIETSGSKGTVEKISVRSVSLRHPRGALATVPYGQIGKVVNYSRDWVIEKLVFRVAFDTDIDLVRKLFKKVGQEIAENPELNKDLLEPFKSQGIAAVEDGTLVIRGKFKARAGQQFAVKKAVLSAVQKVFNENGVHVVSKPLGVGPPGS